MRTLIFSSLVLGALALCPVSVLTAQLVVDFEDVVLPSADSFIDTAFESDGVTFGGQVADFGIYEGYVLSNATVNQDLSVSPGGLFGQPDFLLNQYSAYVPNDGATSNYGVLVFNNSDAPQTGFRGNLSAPSGTQFQSVEIANTTYAAFSILVGDGFSAAFSDVDVFSVTIEGRREGVVSGQGEFVLAEGQNAVDEFTEVSLAALNGADEIAFSLSSTSVSTFGGDSFLNTPTFIAIDNLTFVTAVPEPNSLAILGLGGLTALLRRRKSQHRQLV